MAASARNGAERHLDVVEVRWLEPYHQDHAAIVCTRRDNILDAGRTLRMNRVVFNPFSPLMLLFLFGLLILFGFVIIIFPIIFLTAIGATFAKLGFSWWGVPHPPPDTYREFHQHPDQDA